MVVQTEQTAERPDLDRSLYLATPAAYQLGVLDPDQFEPRPLDDAVERFLDNGRMPNRAGLVIAAGEVAGLDLVECVFIGEDDEIMEVHPGDKGDVSTIERRIRTPGCDLILSSFDGVMTPFGVSVPVARPTDWRAEVPDRRDKISASARSGTQAHRHYQRLGVDLFDPKTVPQYVARKIVLSTGVVIAERIA